MSAGKVYALCLRLMADRGLAEELTAETYLTAWRNISFFREDTLFSSWLTGITTYSILEWIRNNGGIGSRLENAISNGSKNGLSRKYQNTFEAEIQSLPDKERFVFILHDVEKYSVEEVADLLTFTKEDVTGILHNAHKRLVTPEHAADGREYLKNCLKSLPQIIQPENDIWKNIFTKLNREQKAAAKNPGAETQEIEEDSTPDKKKKMFGFLNWKKK